MTRLWDERDKNELWPQFSGQDSGRVVDTMYAEIGSSDPLDQLLAMWQRSWLVEDLLMKADKMSMAASLELRVPFLDYRLVEWANRQSADVKIGPVGRRYVTKNVLRRFASRRLPSEIIDRPKKGFPIPVCRWLTEARFGGWVREHLTGREARLSRLFRSARIDKELHAAAAGDARAGQRIWVLIVLETWLREFDVEPVISQPVGYTLAGNSNRVLSPSVC